MTNDASSELAALEQDLRRLMRAVADARFAAAADQKRARDEKKRTLLAITDVLDAFDRVFRSIEKKPELVTPQMRIWLGNFRSVRRLVENVLANEGVKPMEHADAVFDPHSQTISEIRVEAGQPEGTIVEQSRPGYMWAGDVLRKAEVVVARPPEES